MDLNRRDDEVIRMQHGPIRGIQTLPTSPLLTRRSLSTVLLCGVAAIIAACTEATAPPPASLRVASTRAANSKGDDNRIINDVHAIHVRIRSMVLGVPTVDEYTFHVQQHGREVKGKFF